MRLLQDRYKTELNTGVTSMWWCFHYLENFESKQNENIQKIQKIVNLAMHKIVLLTLVVGYMGVCLAEIKTHQPQYVTSRHQLLHTVYQ